MVRIFWLPTTNRPASTAGKVKRINQLRIKPVRPRKSNGFRVPGIPRRPTVGGKSLSTAVAPSRLQPARQQEHTNTGSSFDLRSRTEPTSLVFPSQKVGGKLRRESNTQSNQHYNNGRAWHVRPGHSVVTTTACSSRGDSQTYCQITVIVK